MDNTVKNVVVIGGSFVGRATAKELATVLPTTHRVVLVEPHTHFHHLFAFPRFSVMPGLEHKAFIPYTELFATSPNRYHHVVIQARVKSLEPKHIVLDRQWEGVDRIPYDSALIATGTTLRFPGTIIEEDKQAAIDRLQGIQGRAARAKSVILVGGGAVGVQMATDLKELYPEKEITLVHSRKQLMPLYEPKLSEIILTRFDELGIKYVLGHRAKLPAMDAVQQQQEEEECREVELLNGDKLAADLVIHAVGQTPNTQFLSGLGGSPVESFVNPLNGFIKIKPTTQLQDERYPNIFAIGDVADTGAHKAARPGILIHGRAAIDNVMAMIKGEPPAKEFHVEPAGIHLTLGIKKNIVYRNSNPANGEGPRILHLDDGVENMDIDGAWGRAGIDVTDAAQYHL